MEGVADGGLHAGAVIGCEDGADAAEAEEGFGDMVLVRRGGEVGMEMPADASKCFCTVARDGDTGGWA